LRGIPIIPSQKASGDEWEKDDQQKTKQHHQSKRCGPNKDVCKANAIII
jgi:hypothetical protein